MTTACAHSYWSPLKAIATSLASVGAAAALGGWGAAQGLASWYPTLTKPSFTPPDAVFAPVWTALYVVMAVGFSRILRTPQTTARRSAIISFIGLLALLGLWPVVFFAMQSPPVAFLTIAGAWSLCVLSFLRFYALDHIAGALLGPLLGWISFAAVLNAAIWSLN